MTTGLLSPEDQTSGVLQDSPPASQLVHRIVNNTVISLAGQVATWSSTILLTAAYGRFLGDQHFGELYFAISFVALIGIPIELGFNQQITRAVAREPGTALRYLSSALLIKASLWLALYALLLLLARLLGYSTEQRTLITICGITLLSGSLATTFAAMHYAVHRVVFPVVGSVFEKVFSAVVGITLLWFGYGVVAMAIVLLCGSLLSSLWQALSFYRRTGLGFPLDRAVVRELGRGSVPFMVYGALGVLYYRLDTVLLSLMSSAAVVGWYGAAYRLFDTLTFLPALVIGPILLPAFSNLSTASRSSLKAALEKALTFLLVCGVPLAVATIVMAPSIIRLLYHRHSFDHSIAALQALAPGLVLLYVNSVFGAAVVSLHREKRMTILAAAALIFNVGLNLYFIPLYRHVGAAAVTSLTELLLLVLSVFVALPRDLLTRRSLVAALRTLGAGMIMALVVWSLRDTTIFVCVPIGFCAYLLALAALGAVPREDMKELFGAVVGPKSKPVPDSDAPQ